MSWALAAIAAGLVVALVQALRALGRMRDEASKAAATAADEYRARVELQAAHDELDGLLSRLEGEHERYKSAALALIESENDRFRERLAAAGADLDPDAGALDGRLRMLQARLGGGDRARDPDRGSPDDVPDQGPTEPANDPDA